VLALVCAGCSEGTDGAISVRWRIVDLTTGFNYDPRQQVFPTGARTVTGDPFPTGSCGCLPDGTPGGCAGSGPGWEVDVVRLVVVDPENPAAAPIAPDKAKFLCNQREATTPFAIKPGRYALSLAAFTVAGGLETRTGATPAPTVRTIKQGEIVNLDVVEIGVHPIP
jgi:hypothetical protein